MKKKISAVKQDDLQDQMKALKAQIDQLQTTINLMREQIVVLINRPTNINIVPQDNKEHEFPPFPWPKAKPYPWWGLDPNGPICRDTVNKFRGC